MTHPVLFEAPEESARRALDAQVARRGAELIALKLELQELQRRYLGELGRYYAELAALEADVAELEIAAGLRRPPLDTPDDEQDTTSERSTDRAAASDELKKMFRDVAKSIHPDLALDERARCRRHSLMAEANRAYAERDADRLRLILQSWAHDPDNTPDLPLDREQRIRRMAALEERLRAIDAEMADLRGSAIFRLKVKIDKTRAEGWDLFAEMILQVKSDIARARARCVVLKAQPAGS